MRACVCVDITETKEQETSGGKRARGSERKRERVSERRERPTYDSTAKKGDEDSSIPGRFLCFSFHARSLSHSRTVEVMHRAAAAAASGLRRLAPPPYIGRAPLAPAPPLPPSPAAAPQPAPPPPARMHTDPLDADIGQYQSMATLQSLPSETSEEASPLEEASEEATEEATEEEATEGIGRPLRKMASWKSYLVDYLWRWTIRRLHHRLLVRTASNFSLAPKLWAGCNHHSAARRCSPPLSGDAL